MAQRLHLRKHAQASVLGDLQISRDIHHRFRVNEMALPIVKVERGAGHMGGHIHEHEVGGDAGPVGKMRKVQNQRCHRRSLGPVGSPAPADPVHRPHLKDVGRAVDETGERMGGLGGTDGRPGIPPVDPVLVIRDLRAAVVLRRLPRQLHLPVSTLRQQIPGRGRHRFLRAAAAAASAATSAG